MNTFKKIIIAIGIFCVVANIAAANMTPLTIFNDPQNTYQSEFNVFVGTQDMGEKVLFTIYNDSSVSCSVTQIFFDAGILGSFCEIINEDGKTNFVHSQGGPKKLPGGKTLEPDFETTEDFSFQAHKSDFSNSKPVNGINPGEWVSLEFCLCSCKTFEDIAAGLADGSLRIGAHVTAFPNGNSYAAVTPEPMTLALLALGSLFIRRT